MSRDLEIREHLTRMLPEAGYTEARASRSYTKTTTKFVENITITDSGRVLVLLQKPGDIHWEQVAAVRLGAVIVCKGFTMIGTHAIDH